MIAAFYVSIAVPWLVGVFQSIKVAYYKIKLLSKHLGTRQLDLVHVLFHSRHHSLVSLRLFIFCNLTLWKFLEFFFVCSYFRRFLSPAFFNDWSHHLYPKCFVLYICISCTIYYCCKALINFVLQFCFLTLRGRPNCELVISWLLSAINKSLAYGFYVLLLPKP